VVRGISAAAALLLGLAGCQTDLGQVTTSQWGSSVGMTRITIHIVAPPGVTVHVTTEAPHGR